MPEIKMRRCDYCDKDTPDAFGGVCYWCGRNRKEDEVTPPEDSILDVCIHSMVLPDCASCLRGEINRMNKHIERLREMLVAAGGGQALEMHDMHWFGRTWDISDVEMLENDLPGMWSGSDFTGGKTDMEE